MKTVKDGDAIEVDGPARIEIVRAGRGRVSLRIRAINEKPVKVTVTVKPLQCRPVPV